MQKQEHNQDPELWGGIECTINRVHHHYFDQLDYSGNYSRPHDLALLAGTGIQKIRYPILWEKHQPEKDSEIDWSWVSSQLQELQSRNIDVIAGLVHHGSGPAFTDLLDEHFPTHLAAYAAKVIRQFPHLTDFTPVNEPLTTARFSGLYGLWYPHKTDDTSFLKMLLNELKGTVLAMQEIRKVNPAARLVQTEDLGKTYSTKPLQYQADFENERRWLTYDFLCGRVNRKHPLWDYLRRNNITEKELAFFQENPCVPDVFGFNHYLTSERFLDGRLHRYPRHTHGGNGRHAYADVEAVRVARKGKSGLGCLLQEAWDRYRQPMAVTEVHLHCHREEQLRWFRQVWSTCRNLLTKGIEIKAVTAWAMLGSFGWNKLLTEPHGEYEPGTFDVRSGLPRPTALARFLKERKGDLAHDELAKGKGWWQRPSRFFHKPLVLEQHFETVSPNGSPLLIIGKNGTLGRAFGRVCDERHLHYQLLSRDECNLCDPASITTAIETFRPWAIVNATGFVRVDDAESEKEKCFADNTTASWNLAVAAARYGIRLVTFSSDLVFDGRKTTPYTEYDQPNPLNTYGLTKARAEEQVAAANADALIIRTSAFFGPWDEYNFAHFVRKSLLNEERISVVHDAVVSPTYVPDLVHATLDLLIDGEKGIWHLANNGEISWADLANEVADRFGLNRKFIQAVSNEDCHYPALRPRYSVLSSCRGIHLPSLDDALRRYTEQMKDAVQKEKQLHKSVRA
ncbi:family 1 glycosylhydrolase [Flavisolibacter nicotianae]|uniref:family 1 glycosylhydrolase n=1 Tax=Flavisolibacter nicotianae TaxID=2364882 RepID=UPI000EAF71A1|nr:family 1 glycosylhydrolase [Flavisolibacter nicotianae]